MWQWGPIEQDAQRTLQQKMTTAPMLIFPDPKLPYTVVTDASNIAVGVVLMQDQGKGNQPIAFLSRKLNNSEQKYSAYERELAAVAFALVS